MNDLAWVPQPCTLPIAERPLRVAEWDSLFSERLTSLSRTSRYTCAWTWWEERAWRTGSVTSWWSARVAAATTPGEDLIRLDIVVVQAHEAVLDALAVRTAAGGEQR
ncbi:hypothetical protein ACFW9O_25700 [Streptomyces sp. NPDC059499]|uniref:hypothetical protein n=1 Tax=Streptomyces sp. NPDC059499 TaxID=3346852 RepID=UPI0036AB77E7